MKKLIFKLLYIHKTKHKSMKKILPLLIFTIFVANATANESATVNLKDLDKVLKQEKYNKLININEGKAEIDQVPEMVYMFSTDRYYTTITYNNTQTRPLTDRSKKFLRKWLDAKYIKDNFSNSTDTQITLINNQINMFYKEINIVDNGKLYNFIIQTPILAKLEKAVQKNSQIQIELLYSGKNYTSGNNFFMITDFSTTKFNNDKIIKENALISAKRMMKNEQYVAALQKLDMFLKQHPNHLEARKNLCLAKYLNSSKLNNPKYTEDAIKCYEDLSKIYESSEVYYTLASIYYTSNMVNQKEKYSKVLQYADRAVRLFKTSHNEGSEKLIYCSSVYLRGMAKIYFKDNDSMMDIENVQNRCPEMISVNIFN